MDASLYAEKTNWFYFLKRRLDFLLRFVKISENLLPPSKILKLSLANPYPEVVPLHQQEQDSLPPTPPEGRGALPLRGLGDG